jgi:hypothetical protein
MSTPITVDQRFWYATVFQWMARWPQIKGASLTADHVTVFRKGNEPLKDFPSTHQGLQIKFETSKI